MFENIKKIIPEALFIFIMPPSLKTLVTRLKNRKTDSKDKIIEVVNNSVRITFFRSILTTLTTIIPVICLMILGAREIVNFNIALFLISIPNFKISIIYQCC